MARSLSGRLPAITVIPLGELQGQIPERLHGVGAMVAGQARHLHMKREGNKNMNVVMGDGCTLLFLLLSQNYKIETLTMAVITIHKGCRLECAKAVRS